MWTRRFHQSAAMILATSSITSIIESFILTTSAFDSSCDSSLVSPRESVEDDIPLGLDLLYFPSCRDLVYMIPRDANS